MKFDKLVLGFAVASMAGAVSAATTAPLGTHLGAVLGIPVQALASGGLVTIAAVALVAGVRMVQRKKR